MVVYSEFNEKSYDDGAESYARTWRGPHRFIDDERRLFQELIPKGEAILDIGCGPGSEAKHWADEGYAVTGIDISHKMIEIAKKRVPKSVFLKMDMHDIAFPPASFMGIWASFSFLHIRIDEANRILQNLSTIVKPHGYIFLGMHSHQESRFVKVPISGLFGDDREQLEAYVQEYSEADIKTLLSESDIEIVSFRKFSRDGGLYPLIAVIGQFPGSY